MACERGGIGDNASTTDGQGGRGGTYSLREAPLESSLRRGEAAVELVRARGLVTPEARRRSERTTPPYVKNASGRVP